MDRTECDPILLYRTFRQFQWINLFFSRYRSLLSRYIIAEMLNTPDEPRHLLDVGCGGGDIAYWLHRNCRHLGLSLTVTGIDPDARAISFSRHQYGDIPGLEFAQRSLFDLPVEGQNYDYIFANHFLHHLMDDDLMPALRIIEHHCERMFLISDLRRSRLSYLAFSSLIWLFFRSSYIYVDGKMSIRRGFRRDEFAALARQAGLAERTRVGTEFPGRIFLVGWKTPRDKPAGY